MDPSEEKKQDTSPVKKRRSRLLPLLSVLFLFGMIGWGGFYYFNSKPVQISPAVSDDLVILETTVSVENSFKDTHLVKREETIQEDGGNNTFQEEQSVHQADIGISATGIIAPAAPPLHTQPEAVPKETFSVCNSPALQVQAFYNHLDSQAYMADYTLQVPSEKHFTDLIHTLLANPPQVTRESDDLYTILKNTAHFFRVLGKDNIIMLKGILDNEKSSLEQILGDYFLLTSLPECSATTYGKDIDNDALYEYACFFLNTMGGRLYLFRRDSLSRMVVTYYAILLVDQANTQNNNFHGIALKPAVDMLISEMETGGSSLKRADTYLDTLYELKEKLQ